LSSSPLRCLVVEDQLMMQQLLMAMLGQHPALQVVGSACSVAEGIAACSALIPDLLILDIALPDGDGLTVARALARLDPSARVIVLSSFAGTVERPPELRSQIVAILDKSRAYQDLIREVEALLPEGLPPRPAPSLDLTLLTPREREILELVGRGWSSRSIAERLIISPHTVETHRRNICSKLGLSGAALVRQASLLVQSFQAPGGA
jgi:DNA-binding NarL/FixJ family response regulator